MNENSQSVLKKENHRIFNLIWVALFAIFGIALFLHPLEDPNNKIIVYLDIAICLLEILIIIVPKRNNFVSAFLLFIIAELAENSVLRIQEHNIFNRITFSDGFFGNRLGKFYE